MRLENKCSHREVNIMSIATCTDKNKIIDEIICTGMIYHTPTPTRSDMLKMNLMDLKNTYVIIIENLRYANKL